MKQEMMTSLWDGSGIRCTMQIVAPCYREITTPEPHHSVFAFRMLFLTPNQH